LDSAHAKGAFLQVGTHFLLPKGLKDLLNVLQVLFPTLSEDENVVQINDDKRFGKGPENVIH